MKKNGLLSAICTVVLVICTWFYSNTCSVDSSFSLVNLIDIEALGDSESETGTCSISYDCLDSMGHKDGSIRCSGTRKCERGIESIQE